MIQHILPSHHVMDKTKEEAVERNEGENAGWTPQSWIDAAHF